MARTEGYSALPEVTVGLFRMEHNPHSIQYLLGVRWNRSDRRWGCAQASLPLLESWQPSAAGSNIFVSTRGDLVYIRLGLLHDRLSNLWLWPIHLPRSLCHGSPAIWGVVPPPSSSVDTFPGRGNEFSDVLVCPVLPAGDPDSCLCPPTPDGTSRSRINTAQVGL